MIRMEEAGKKISVIIPVYNVEPWIGECIESLKKQKQEGLEFIFVDDCGTDNSMKIVESWAAEDKRVRILRNKENAGSGPSRNAGIAAARGQYISNIDPDDWVSDNYYEMLYSKAVESGCDIVKGTRVEYKDGKTHEELKSVKASGRLNSEIMERSEKGLPLHEVFTYEHTTAIYKADLLSDKNIRYGTSKNSGDVLFLLKVCKNTESIAVTEDAVYYYRQRAGATTSEYSMRRTWNELETLEETISYLKNVSGEEPATLYLQSRIRNNLSNYYYATRAEDVSESVRKDYQNHFKNVIGRLGFMPSLFEGFAELEVFLNYGFIIPFYKIKNGREFYDGVERWTEFFEAQGQNTEEIHHKGYASALYRSLCWTFKYGPRRRYMSIIRHDPFYKSMLGRLSRRDRNRVLQHFKKSEKSYQLLHGDSTNPKVSVIIPVYNAEKYITRCIESLRAQTLKELEFIFVDDCSPDGSMVPVYKWASFDSRVTIIRNGTNLGEGGSRNRGIEAARGLYVNTIDPDDWVSCDYYELLYAKAVKTGADIVKGTRIKIKDDTYEEEQPRSNYNEAIEIGLAKGRALYTELHYEHQTIIVKRMLLNDEIRYGASGNACDTTFLLYLCSAAKSLAMEKDALYYYLQRAGSATGSYSLGRSKNELISFKEQIGFLMRTGSPDLNAYRYCLSRYRTYSSRFCHAVKGGCILSQDREDYISELKEFISIITPLLQIYGSTPEIEALVEDKCLLAAQLCEDSKINAEEISDWIGYASSKHSAQRNGLNERIARLLVEHLERSRDSRHGRENLKADLLRKRAELKRLDKKDRLFIYYKTYYFIIRRKLVNRAIRHKKIIGILAYMFGK